MSGRVLNWAARVSAGDLTANAVLMILAEAADNEGKTFVGQETIAARLDTARLTVNRAMKRLEVRGLIVRSPRRRADGYRSSDLIRLTLCDGSLRDAGLRNNEAESHVSQSDSLTPSMNPQTVPSPKAKGYPEAFEALWKAYPHFRGRSDKAKSYKTYTRLGEEERAGLAGAIDAFRATPAASKDGGQYVKAFERWLTSEQWRDFTAPETPSPGKPDDSIDWALRLSLWREHGSWPASWGEKPGREGCQVPREVLEGACVMLAE